MKTNEKTHSTSKPNKKRWVLVFIGCLTVPCIVILLVMFIYNLAYDLNKKLLLGDQKGKIAYSADGNIYIVEPGGNAANIKKVVQRSTANSPDWSPSGNILAFESGEGYRSEIYTISIDEGIIIRLTDNNEGDYQPNWSPTGDKLAFVSGRDGSGLEIYIMNFDGSNPTRITHTDEYEFAPEWSPDGNKIAFFARRADGPSTDIYVMNIDGSNKINLSRGYTRNKYPAWSPDGEKIAFACGQEICLINPDGTNLTVLVSDDDTYYSDLSWSPDGKWIVASTLLENDDMGSYPNLVFISSDGKRILDSIYGEEPDWSP